MGPSKNDYALFDRFGNPFSFVDLEEKIPVNHEYQIEVHAVDPAKSKTSLKSIPPSQRSGTLLTLKVSIKKIDFHLYHCTWEISYGTSIIKSYNQIEEDLELFELKTHKVKNILSCYHVSEPLRKYLDQFIPPIQQE